MRRFLCFSLLVHLSFFLLATVLSRGLRVNALPTLDLEVFLEQWRPKEEKHPEITIWKDKKRAVPLPSQTLREREDKEFDMGNAPDLAEAVALLEASPPPAEEKGEKNDEEVGSEKRPLPMIPLAREMVLTTQGEDLPQLLPSSFQSVSLREEHVLPTPSTVQKIEQPSASELMPIPIMEGIPSPIPQKVEQSSGSEEVALLHPRYAETPKPPYPREAQRKGFQGEVVLKVEVLSNGLVGQVEIKKSSGYEILDLSALSAVKKWKFIPARMGGSPISAWVNIPIRFQLQ